MFVDIISVPTTGAVETGISTYSLWIGGALLAFALVLAALAIGSMATVKISTAVTRAAARVLSRKGGGRRRRR